MILACKARYNNKKEITRRRFMFEYNDRYYFVEARVEAKWRPESDDLFNIEHRKLDFIDCSLPAQEKRKQALNYGKNMKGRHLEYPSDTFSIELRGLYDRYIPVLRKAVKSIALVFNYQHDELKSRPHSLNINQKEFYHNDLAFPIDIDDIDTISDDNLSFCSGDTQANVNADIEYELDEELERNDVKWPIEEPEDPGDRPDVLADFLGEHNLYDIMYSEHIYYNKVLEALKGKRAKCDMTIAEKEVDKLVQMTSLNKNLALVIFRFTHGIIPTKEEMRRRRIELWRAKLREIEDQD